MAKHVHIFLGPKIRAVTTDSPDWEESKHPRADNGQFGKGSGGSKKPAAKSTPEKPKQKVDPISHRTSMDPAPKAFHTAPMTKERAEANAQHHAGLYHSTKDPEAKAHHQAEFQKWKKEAARLGGPQSHVASGLQQNQEQSEASTKPEAKKKMSEAKGDPDADLVTMKTGGTTEKTFAIPKPPVGTTGGPQAGRGPVDLGNQRQAKPREMGSPRYTGQSFLPKVKMSQARAPAGATESAQEKWSKLHAEYKALYKKSSSEANAFYKKNGMEELRQQVMGPAKVAKEQKSQSDYNRRFDAVMAAGGGNPSPVRAPERTPMRQAMRNQEATGIKEARRVAKQPSQAGTLKSTAMMQSEATIAEVLNRIRARKK